MLIIDRLKYLFRIREIWFSDCPFDVKGCSSVIFKDCMSNVNLKGFQKREFTTLIIDLTQEFDILWKNMSKSSCRYAINRAKKEGVRIKINSNYEEFYEINKLFRESKKLDAYALDLNFIKNYCTLFVSEFDNEILGGQLFLEDDSYIRWLIGSSRRLEVDKEKASLIGNANRLMLWEAMQYAKKKGIITFDMGGYYTGEIHDPEKERINSFKSSFGGVATTHYIYCKDYSINYMILKKFYALLKYKPKLIAQFAK